MSNSFKFYLAIFIFTIPTPSWGERGDNNNILISYPLSRSQSNAHFYKEWKTDKDLIPGKYRLRANIAIKTLPHPVEFDSLDLTPKLVFNGGPLLPELGPAIQSSFLSKKPSEPVTENLPLTTTIKKEIKIDDFDELQMDYQDMGSDNPSLINIKLVLSGKKIEGNTATVVIKERENQLVPLTLSDLVSSPWEKKDYFYIAKRWLELSFDSRWRYIFKSKDIFYQKRFHQDFSSIEVLDIVFKPGTSYELINSLNCNLRFNFDSRLQPSKIVECKKFPQRLIKVRGNTIRRIWVGNFIRSQFRKKGEIYLGEIIFILPRKSIKDIQEQPVGSVNLQSMSLAKAEDLKKRSGSNQKVEPAFQFSSSIEVLSTKRKRLILPLKQFSRVTGINGKISSLTLTIKPQILKSPYQFHLKSLRAVNFKNEERLSILNFGENLNKRWGKTFSNLEKNKEKLERIQVKGFFPFYSPQIDQQTLSGSKNSLIIRNQRVNQSKPVDTINFRHVKIRTPNNFSSWHSDNGGLRLSGNGNWIEITWPVNGKIEKNTHFFIGIGEGEENIHDLQIKPLIKDWEPSPILVLPNKPEELKDISGKFDGFKIRISFLREDFNIQLKELAVFRPFLLSAAQVLDTPILFEGETPLFPKKIQSVPKRKVDLVKGHLSAPLFPSKSGRSEISWQTEVQRKISRIQGLKVSYKMFPQIHHVNPCWLQFTLVSSNHQIDGSLCPENSSGQIAIPREILLNNTKFQADEMLKHITWKIQAKAKNISKKLSSRIDLGVTLIGHDFQTIRDELTKYPFVELNGKSIYAESLGRVSSEKILSGNFSASLGTVTIKDEKNYPSLKIIKHPHINIKNIVLEKIEPINLKEYESLIEEYPEQSTSPKSGNFPSFFKPVFFLLLILVIGWGVKHPGLFHRLQEMVKLSPDTALKQFLFFASAATVFYLLGLFFSLIRWHLLEETCLSLAGIPIILAARIVIWWIRPYLESRWPGLAAHVYRGPGTPYIVIFFLAIILAVFFLVFPVNILAEHIGVNSYYMLVVGVYLEARALRKKNKKQKGEDILIDPEKEAKRA